MGKKKIKFSFDELGYFILVLALLVFFSICYSAGGPSDEQKRNEKESQEIKRPLLKK